MKTHLSSSLLVSTVLFFSCSNPPEPSNLPVETEQLQDDSATFVSEADTVKRNYEIKENQENLQKIEKQYGEQWEFCKCVIANDSIDKAVKKIDDFESPQAEKLLNRFDYVAKKCQAFLGMDSNRTPEERAKHEKKVKKCLKNAN